MPDEISVLGARLRVAGHLPEQVADPDEWQALGSRLARQGRRLVRMADDGAPTRVTMGWADGEGPPQDPEVLEVLTPDTSTHAALAGVLACCWRDRTQDPWPGEPAEVNAVLAVMGAAPDVMGGRTSHLLRGLGYLEAAGVVDWDVDAGIVRPGPAVAAWNRDTVETFRRIAAQLPEPPGASDG